MLSNSLLLSIADKCLRFHFTFAFCYICVVYSHVWRGTLFGPKLSFKLNPDLCQKVFISNFFWPSYKLLEPDLFTVYVVKFFLFQVLSGEEVGSEAAGAATVFSGGGTCSSHRGILLASFYGGLLWGLLWDRLL